MAKVSILITVYNEEKYLRECLDSLQKQSLEDFEAVCINDASTDGSLKILNEYAERDKRFIVKNNSDNIGLTQSRKKAFTYSCGKYVVLLDGDDFLSENALETAVNAMEYNNANLVLFDLQMYYGHNNIQSYTMEPLSPVIDGKTAFRLCIQGRLHSIYMTSRDMYNKFPIDDTCRLYTDDNTARMHLLLANKVCFCEGKYFYRRHSESETHKIHVSRFYYITANKRLAAELQNRNIGISERQIFEIHRWKNLIAHIHLFEKNKHVFSGQEKNEINDILGTALKTIDFSLLPRMLLFRLPYYPVKNLCILKAMQKIYLVVRKLRFCHIQQKKLPLL